MNTPDNYPNYFEARYDMQNSLMQEYFKGEVNQILSNDKSEIWITYYAKTFHFLWDNGIYSKILLKNILYKNCSRNKKIQI